MERNTINFENVRVDDLASVALWDRVCFGGLDGLWGSLVLRNSSFFLFIEIG